MRLVLFIFVVVMARQLKPLPPQTVMAVPDTACVETIEDVQADWKKNILVTDGCTGGEAVCQCYQ